ncbi:hypothetical protein [Brevibacillus centrosporus]|uniref:hypothetical protein n=1 Tax=Brevibacillus centrosporus TaxID=54910 RepID=UPI002E1ECCC3|nr:hypothetical protein [Brevibacillus centrosporus]
MSSIARDILFDEYVNKRMTDLEIAEKYGLTRTAISKMRKRVGIKSKDFTGQRGEALAIDELMAHGFKVENMNKKSMTYPFDLLINDSIRVEVKSATLIDGYHRFILTESSENGNIESENRIKLSNGRTKKRFDKTCDFILLVGIDPETQNKFFLIPSYKLPESIQTIAIPSTLNSKYAEYKDRWDFLMP